MRAKLTLLSALSVGLLGGALAAGCQTYDFEPVEPLAISQTTETRRIEVRELKPNLMLLVDTSGSMTYPVDTNDPDCWVNGNPSTACGTASPCDTRVCPTRWSELQAAMEDFLSSSGSLARMGLTTYPDTSAGDSCGASVGVSIPLPAPELEDNDSLAAQAQEVRNKLLAIRNYTDVEGEQMPVGGTPTSLSLEYVGSLADLGTADRADFVLLLTDGLPNCNAAHPNPWKSDGTGCFCTLAGGDCQWAREIGCLDKDASVVAVEGLKDKEIKTIVIGFGADFDPSQESGFRGAQTLNSMAEAGGFARTCTVDLDCGAGDTCDTAAGLCNRRFYQAANRAELVEALREITRKVGVGDPCVLLIDEAQRPSSAELVVVYLNGERLAAGADTWSLTDEGIQFSGSTCTRIMNSTPANPVDIEVRAVQRR